MSYFHMCEHRCVNIFMSPYLSAIHEALTANYSGTDITKEQGQFVGVVVSFMYLLLPLWLTHKHL